jgi:anthranilate phosphoribosyltransferase
LIHVSSDGTRREVINAGKELGFRHDVASLRGGDVEVNVRVVREFLSGALGAVHNVVCANAALTLLAAGRAATLLEGYELARASVSSGAANTVLERMVEVTQRPN